MADLQNVREYEVLERHRTEVRQKSRRRWLRFGIALVPLLVATVAAFGVQPELGLFVGAISGGILFFLSLASGSSVAPSALIGVAGEAAALERLGELPDGWRVFNQVHVPDPEAGGYGRRELDFVVIGTGRVFVVEVKNVSGAIEVRPDARNWPVARRRCGNRPGWDAMANPLGQVSNQVRALEGWLLRNGISVQVEPVVCFSNPDSMLQEVQRSPMALTGLDGLVPELLKRDRRDRESAAVLKRVSRQLSAG